MDIGEFHMTKEEKKLVRRYAIGALLLMMALIVLIYYLFFYRENSPFSVKEYSSVKHVLFISSYSESFETLDPQKAGIREAFAGNNIELNIEYMDMKRFNNKENEDLFYQSLKYKLQHCQKYDAILLGDDAALEFAETYQQELFAGIPMVFFCINNVEHAVRAGENPYITGAVEEMYLEDTFNLAIKFQPEATKIVAIYDSTLTGQGDEKQFYSVEGDFPGYEFSGINSSEYTLEEFGEELDGITQDSIVVYMSRFEDKDGNLYTIPESVQYIVEHTKVPIYRASIAGVGEGLLGGKMVSYEKSGYLAGSIVLDILNGADIADIPVVTRGESQYCFDYQVLRKYDIDFSLIPKDAIIVNKSQTVFEKYREILLPVLLFLAVCLCVLLVSIVDNIKRRRLMREVQKSHDELKETYNKLIITEEKLKQQYEENKNYIKYLEAKEEYILYQAEHDYLTDLPNRRAAMEMLSRLIAAKEECTVIVMDIDDFKETNDTYGHACGDEILMETARRLTSLMDDKLLYASRLGGDEFLLIIRGTQEGHDSKLVCQIKQITAMPITFDEKKHYMRISVGIAYFKGDAASASEIVSNADYAMYASKKLGTNEWVYYDAGMKDEALRRKGIKNILSEACRNDGFYVLYQPQVDAATGMLDGYEALTRLKGHAISPAQFIAIAEESEIIVTLGRIVTKKVIEQMVTWREHGMELKPVAVNFSSKQIQDSGYVSYLKDLLEENDISSDLIEIEITESIFLNNNEKAMKLFEDFSSIGVRLALDDFGTGYSSINYLTYIPVEKIKLDKSLVDIFLTEGKDAFIENIIRLAHCLGLKITVEGVEEKHQRDRVRDLEGDYIQGYYFSKPISGEEVELLKNPIK
jgi:diguanylate cyclase (GGDEF)-like protein